MTKDKDYDNPGPVHVIRVQSVKATIWAEKGKKGNYYSVTIARSYRRSDGKYADINSFSQMELLAAAYVAQRASDYIQSLGTVIDDSFSPGIVEIT